MQRQSAIARAVFETLESRRLLAGVVINEFLANNNSGLLDQDNDHSDWIELKNTDSTTVNLAGWYLTDDAANLTKWQFPSTTLAGNSYLVVFASGKNRVVSGQQLHTNFELDADNGEYLALVKPDGTTLADQYNPFPPQLADVSYGKGATSTVTDTLVSENSAVKAIVPSAASSIDSTWRNLNFTPDGTWKSSSTGDGVGYDTSPSPVDYSPYIDINVQTEMSGTNRTSAYIRIPFTVSDPSVLASLKLSMRYDDGFIAYINGTEIGSGGNDRRNFSSSATPAWNSIASGSRSDDQCIIYEDMDISSNLNLLQPGNNVLAIQALNVQSSSDLLIQPMLTADRSVSTQNSFMSTPTPGAANSIGTLGFVGDTHFSFDRGFYTSPFDVAITSSTTDAQIRYTLDGSPPTATTGTIYTGPIHITTTSELRAAAFKTGWTPTDVDTQTYVFLNDVIHQTGTGLPTYATWGHNGPDWAMDPNIVNSPTYSGQIVNDLKAVPTMSLVMPWSDWFGANGVGIYPTQTGQEKQTSIEWIDAGNSTNDFHTDGAVEIQGASSTQRWNEDKLSMRLTFKPPFGPTKLNANVFNNIPSLDNNTTSKFDRLILDAMYDDTWMDPSSTNRANAKEFQDQYAADLQNLAGSHGPHGRFIQLYLNGLYWGMYYLHEEPDDSYAEEYLGGDKSDYDVLKHNSTTVVAGGSQATTDYNNMLTAVRNDMTVAANYTAVTNLLDVTDFIDYMIVNYYVGNTDWASHNWYASFNRVDPNGRWRFHEWDAELSLQSLTTDNTTKNDTGAPTEINQRLMANPEYKLKFDDEVNRLMFNGGVLSPTGAANTYSLRINEITQAIVGESARWGDNHGTPALTEAGWATTQNNMLSSYFPSRTSTVNGQFNTRGWLQSIAAPTYSQFGGTVNPGYQLTISKTNGTTIYYTTDGSDPRLSGGGISSSAIAYSGPITINVAKRIKARVYNGGTTWSALTDATFLMPTLYPVRIDELHYHPAPHSGVADPETMEFIELVNTGTSTVDLKNVSITKFASTPYTFTSTLNLAAGQRIVVAQNRTIFQQVYGSSINLAPGQYDPGNLSNGGEEIALLGPLGETLQDFTYGDNTAPGWPATPDGGGPSLELNDPLADPAVGANWHASFVTGGTPGTVSVPPTALASTFVFATTNAVTIQFDHDMDQSSFASADINIQLQPVGAVFHPDTITFPYSKTASFNFTTPLADGDYHATLLAGSVKDLAGQSTAAATDLDFFALGADANHDRHVDAADQAILTAHLNQAGTFADGDFDRNGTVNSADQTILDAALNLWLPPVGALSLPATTGGDDVYKLRRESASIAQVFVGANVNPTYRVMLTPVTTMSFIGSGGNDTLTFDTSNGAPIGSLSLNFDGGNADTDTFNVVGSSASDTALFTNTSVTLGSTITYAGVEVVTFTGNGGGDNLTINSGSVALTAVESLSSLTVASGATLDVKKFGFALNYTGSTPIDSIEQSIVTARNGGTWTGSGIITSQSNAHAPSSLATLGVAEASNVVSFNGHATAVWQGQTVDQTTVLVRYTYIGDATLDGIINGDDYFQIDSGFVAHAHGFGRGDFNEDGKINADDYFLIDSNYNKAQSPLANAPVIVSASAFDPMRGLASTAPSDDTSAYQRLIEGDSTELL